MKKEKKEKTIIINNDDEIYSNNFPIMDIDNNTIYSNDNSEIYKRLQNNLSKSDNVNNPKNEDIYKNEKKNSYSFVDNPSNSENVMGDISFDEYLKDGYNDNTITMTDIESSKMKINNYFEQTEMASNALNKGNTQFTLNPFQKNSSEVINKENERSYNNINQQDKSNKQNKDNEEYLKETFQKNKVETNSFYKKINELVSDKDSHINNLNIISSDRNNSVNKKEENYSQSQRERDNSLTMNEIREKITLNKRQSGGEESFREYIKNSQEDGNAKSALNQSIIKTYNLLLEQVNVKPINLKEITKINSNENCEPDGNIKNLQKTLLKDKDLLFENFKLFQNFLEMNNNNNNNISNNNFNTQMSNAVKNSQCETSPFISVSLILKPLILE